jgi:hypothetical protein
VAIQESIEFDLDAGPIEAAASAADDLAVAADEARAALGDVEASSIEDTTDAADDATSALEDASDAATDLGESAAEAGQDGASAFSDMAEAAAGIGGAVMVLDKVGKAAGKVLDVAVAFGKAVVEAHAFNSAATAALDQLTGGRGEQALSSLASQAADLGISTESAVEQFTALRNAGASNADATALISLRADLLAVGVSAGDADAAIKKATEAIKAGGDADAVIGKIADAYGAAGDGANAAAKRALTLEGAMANAGLVGQRAFSVIADRAGPALDAVGAKITSVLDSFEDSGAVESLGDTIASALEYVPPIIDGILAAWDSFKSSAQPGIDALSQAFGVLSDALGESGGGMSAASAIGSALGFVVSTIATAIAGVVGVIGGFVAGWNMASGAVSSAIDAITSAIDSVLSIDLASAGTNLVQSFIDGIVSMVGSVIDAASSIGDAAAGAIKSALGIASPSKVGLELGGNLGESVGTGAEEAMPAEIEPPALADLPKVAPSNGNGGGAELAAPGGGALIGSLTVIVQVPGGTNASAQDIGTEVRRAVETAIARRAAA